MKTTTAATRLLIRADGTQAELSHLQITTRRIAALIHADTLDTVNLRDGHVMFGDDAGHARALPINPQATRRYWAVCQPGTTHQIVGDVVIAPDSDFSRPASRSASRITLIS